MRRIVESVAAVAVALGSLLVAPSSGAAQAPELGEIHFPVSASGPAAGHFRLGVLYLHSFEYGEARREFRAAREADPGFAMAYWGEAMTHNHPVWFEQDDGAGRAALERLAPTREGRLAKAGSEKERDWLRAVDVLYHGESGGSGPGGGADGFPSKEARDDAYAREMARLAAKYPDDHEFRAFHALSLLGTAHEGRHVPTYMKAAAIADRIFEENPRHPGAAHYLIHAFDDPAHAPLGLPAARAYSEIAPSASHARHMTSHIFVALGLWEEVVAANRTAYEVSGGRNYHAYYWLAYGLLQQGRVGEAADVFRDMYRTQREEATRRKTAGAADRGDMHYPAMARAQYLVHSGDWEGEIAEIRIRPGTLGVEAAAATRFVDGWAALARDDLATARRQLRALRGLADSLAAAGAGPVPRGLTEVDALELAALLARAEGRTTEALELLQRASKREGELPATFGPPRIPKPSAELLGETLLALDRPAEALTAFRTALERAPRRIRSLEGLAAAARATGDGRTAASAEGEIAEIRERVPGRRGSGSPPTG